MPRRYQPSEIEPKWQSFWDQNKTFRTPGPGDEGFDPDRPKYYILDMFPYPSGAGLHVGHPEGYTATDILARYKRMKGYNVLHPMGWDAFGLPAEQYAVQTGTHPSVTTRRNIDNFRRQIKSLGFGYDWDREVNTTDPGYYRWTQWIFNLLFDTWFDEEQKRGRPISELPVPDGLSDKEAASYRDQHRLAYLDEIAVWWCSELGTVLANEEVIDGRSERGSFPCIRQPLSQWMLRITAYAERLLEDLDEVDWPEETKKQQREWIGRSRGAEVWFACEAAPDSIEADGERLRLHQGKLEFKIFTTRPDTLFGATYMVLAPEHPLVEVVTSRDQQSAVEAHRQQSASKSELDRTAAKEKTGVFTGGHAINPVNQQRIPIYVADYVLYSYGAGAIMAVPGHDERDFDFALAYDLPILPVYEAPEAEVTRSCERGGETVTCFSGDGVAINSPWIDGLATAQAKNEMIRRLEEQGLGEAKVNYRLRDWIFSRQRYWGEPFPILFTEDGQTHALSDDQLPLRLPPVEDFKPSGRPEPLLAKATDWIETEFQGQKARRETNTMPNWAGSCWYYLRYLDPRNDLEAWSAEKEKYWMPVDLYVGGREHAVLHLLYARFWHKVLYDRGFVSTKEPFKRLFHQGLILAFAYQDPDTKVLIPSDQVSEQEDGTFLHEPTGKTVDQCVAKMSKALKNVVNPDDIVGQYGADAFRIYEMYMGPLADSKPWDSRAVDGMLRFLQRSFRLFVDEEGQLRGHLQSSAQPDPELEKALHQMLKKVDEDLEKMAFNTAIAAMIKFVNTATPKVDRLTGSQLDRYARVLSVFAPHLGEELWEILGNEPSVLERDWPEHDPALLVESTLEYPVQVNGKVRSKIVVPADIDDKALEEKALAAVSDHINGQKVRKVIIVPKRLVNVVAK